MVYGLIILTGILLVVIGVIFLVPSIKANLVNSYKEGHKSGEEWAKNSSLGNMAHNLGKKAAEVEKKLKNK